MSKTVKVKVTNTGKPNMAILATKLLDLSYKNTDKKQELTA
jgi:hypothetical protein